MKNYPEFGDFTESNISFKMVGCPTFDRRLRCERVFAYKWHEENAVLNALKKHTGNEWHNWTEKRASLYFNYIEAIDYRGKHDIFTISLAPNNIGGDKDWFCYKSSKKQLTLLIHKSATKIPEKYQDVMTLKNETYECNRLFDWYSGCTGSYKRNVPISLYQYAIMENERREKRGNLFFHNGFAVVGSFKNYPNMLPLEWPTTNFDTTLINIKKWMTHIGQSFIGCGPLEKVFLSIQNCVIEIDSNGIIIDQNNEKWIRQHLNNGYFPDQQVWKSRHDEINMFDMYLWQTVGQIDKKAVSEYHICNPETGEKSKRTFRRIWQAVQNELKYVRE